MTAVIMITVLCVLLLCTCALAGFWVSCGRRKRLFDPDLLPPGSPRAKNDRLCAEGAKRLLSFAHEDLTLTAHDGVRLVGRFYDNGQNERFVLLVHGYHSTPERDFGAVAHLYLSLGYGVLMITQRAHENSGGHFITYGAKERYDVCAWCTLLARRYPAARILLHGISMGGATVLLAAEVGLPEQVCGIVDDCGYTRPSDEITHIAKTSLHLPRAAVTLADLACRCITGCSLTEPSVKRAGAHCSLPKLYLHGEADTFVPYAMGWENYMAALQPKRFVSIPNAGHGMCYFTDVETVGRELTEFAKNVFG